MAIRYIQNKDIDYKLWDSCINHSLNGLIYANSWFLDVVAEQWDALVEDDYLSVMPLVYRRRLFFDELYTPFLAKQLGVFSVTPVKAEKIKEFLEHIPGSFKKIHLCLNRHNTQSLKNKKDTCKSCFEIDLIAPYEKKKKSYSDSALKHISTAIEKKLTLIRHTSLYDLENFLLKNLRVARKARLITSLRQILSRLVGLGKAEIIGAYGPENELCSVACFVKSTTNVILLFAHTAKQGDLFKANYLIIDTFLKNYSSHNVTISLDYIDKSWNAGLYKEFKALESHYCCISKNRLPFFVRWFFILVIVWLIAIFCLTGVSLFYYPYILSKVF
ncbi:hypothetical protein ES708_15717 [subsurface metagenome]